MPHAVILGRPPLDGSRVGEGPFFRQLRRSASRRCAALLSEGRPKRISDGRRTDAHAPPSGGRPGVSFPSYHRADMALPRMRSRVVSRRLPYTVRFAMPQEEIAWAKRCHGTISWQFAATRRRHHPALRWLAIYNQAWFPRHAMQITHVMRGTTPLRTRRSRLR